MLKTVGLQEACIDSIFKWLLDIDMHLDLFHCPASYLHLENNDTIKTTRTFAICFNFGHW